MDVLPFRVSALEGVFSMVLRARQNPMNLKVYLRERERENSIPNSHVPFARVSPSLLCQQRFQFGIGSAANWDRGRFNSDHSDSKLPKTMEWKRMTYSRLSLVACSLREEYITAAPVTTEYVTAPPVYTEMPTTTQYVQPAPVSG